MRPLRPALHSAPAQESFCYPQPYCAGTARSSCRQRTFKGEVLGAYTTLLGLEAVRTQVHQMARNLESMHMVMKHSLA